MSEPEGLPEMTSRHVDAILSRHAAMEESSGRTQYGLSPKPLREALSVIQGLASRKYVLVDMREIEALRTEIQEAWAHLPLRGLAESDINAARRRLSRWLSAAPPTENTK